MVCKIILFALLFFPFTLFCAFRLLLTFLATLFFALLRSFCNFAVS